MVLASSQGNFELNVFKLLIAANVLQGCERLSGAATGFLRSALKVWRRLLPGSRSCWIRA